MQLGAGLKLYLNYRECCNLTFVFARRQVLGLTLPTLDPPRAKACERTTCTVEWASSFVKQGEDQTKLGFNLSFVPAAISNASTAEGDDDGGGGYLEVMVSRALLCTLESHATVR